MSSIYPYLLAPAYKDYIWGGSRIPEVFRRDLPEGIYAESWEVSDRQEGPSTILNGPLAGQSLAEAISQFGSDITGSSDSTALPLLIKLIDARQHLSVQVHPHDSNAHLTGGEPKTEMWYVIDAEPDAKIYAGLKAGTTREQFESAIQSSKLESVLNAFEAEKGQVFFIPGGRVHAIGAGCLLLEVQQNSNTTYRVYDWGRVDDQGVSRELHVDQAMQVIDWDDRESPIQEPISKSSSDDAAVFSLLDTEWFSLDRIDLTGAFEMETDGSSFHALFSEAGSFVVRTDDGDTRCGMGQSCLIPAATKAWSIVADNGEARVLIASM